MRTSINRRGFLRSTALAGASALAVRQALAAAETVSPAAVKPIVISSANGLQASAKAMEMIQQGADALDAVVAGVNIVEDDPKDTSVGYGGLPNEDGVVELDACVMHGATGRGGGVAALQNIKNPSKVAKLVMERTDHVLLVGAGALRFAKAHGFKEEDLLTEESREAWLRWKETVSDKDDWLPPHGIDSKDVGQGNESPLRHHGTINCDAIDLKGNISGCTTTSGMAFKLAGRVGDSPILGAGLWVDNDVGAAGSTGRGRGEPAGVQQRDGGGVHAAGQDPRGSLPDGLQTDCGADTDAPPSGRPTKAQVQCLFLRPEQARRVRWRLDLARYPLRRQHRRKKRAG